MTRWGRLAASVAVLTGAVVILHGAGPALGTPPVVSPGRWPAWAAGREPLVVAFAVARITALALAWYLLAVTVLGAGARAVHSTRVVAMLDKVTVGPIRGLLAASMSLSLVATTGVTAAGAGARPLAAVAVHQSASSSGEPPDRAASPPATVTMHRLPEAAQPEAAQSEEESTRPPDDQWTVAPGQCFWSIAESVVRRARGPAAADAEVVAYWLRLIAANRAVLADPANPDLIFPGQVLTIAALDGAAPSLAATL